MAPPNRQGLPSLLRQYRTFAEHEIHAHARVMKGLTVH